jgi:hypothetical protein
LVLPLGDGIGDSVSLSVVSGILTTSGIGAPGASTLVLASSSGVTVRSLGIVTGAVAYVDPLCDPVVDYYCDYVATWAVDWDGRDGNGAPVAVGDYEVRVDGVAEGVVSVHDLALIDVTGPGGPSILAPYADGIRDSLTVDVVGITYGSIPVPTTGSAVLTNNTDSSVVQTYPLPDPLTTHSVVVQGLPYGDYNLAVTLAGFGQELTKSYAISSVPTAVQSTSSHPSIPVVYPSIDGYRDSVTITVTSVTAPGVPIPVSGTVTISRAGHVVKTLPLTTSTQNVTWNGRDGARIVPGTYVVQAKVKGVEGAVVSAAPVALSVRQTYVTKAIIGLTYTTTFPVRDGYRDYLPIRVGGLQSTGRYGHGSMTMQVRLGTRVVARWSWGNTAVRVVNWNGRVARALRPGNYTIVLTAKGPEGRAVSLTRRVTVSPKKLVTRSALESHTYTAAYARDDCGGYGYNSCDDGWSWYINGRQYSSVTRYYSGIYVDDLLWSAHSLPLPSGTTSYRIRTIADTFDASFALGLCYSDATNVNDCPTGKGKRFPLNSSGTFDLGWYNIGAADRRLDFYIGTADWGSIYIARFIVDSKRTYKVLV